MPREVHKAGVPDPRRPLVERAADAAGMQRYWSSSGNWGERVSRIASSLRLADAPRALDRFAAPEVRGGLTGGSRARVGLRWSGGAIPSGIVFRATWVPLTLDAEVSGRR